MGSRSRVGGTCSAPTVIRSVRPAPEESSLTPLLGTATPRQPARTTRNSVLFLGAPLHLSIAESAGSMCGSRPGLATRSIHDKVRAQAGSRRTSDHSATGPSLGLPPAPTRNPPREGAG